MGELEVAPTGPQAPSSFFPGVGGETEPGVRVTSE
jgi:hypothetical protein